MDGTSDVQMQDETLHDVNMATIPPPSTNDLTDPVPEPQAQPAQPAAPELVADNMSAIPPSSAALAPQPPRPSSIPPAPAARPEKPAAHGGPTRQYLNQNITPHLLEGMKYLAMYEPEKPLNWLADFLKDRSKQVEG